jgi:hypothetical protein
MTEIMADLLTDDYDIDKMKNKKYHNVGTVPKFNWNITKKECKFNTPNSQNRSLSWLGTYTSTQSGGVELVLYVRIL